MSHFKKLLALAIFTLLPIIVSAQTCERNGIPTTPTSRFTVNNNGTVSDTKTGLMWKKCSEGQSGSDCRSGSATKYGWEQALRHAQTVNNNGGFASYSDWRVPNLKELLSIVEEQCVEPSINLTIFPNVQSRAMYWSSLTHPGMPSEAWVYVDNGELMTRNKGYDHYVRLVRPLQKSRPVETETKNVIERQRVGGSKTFSYTKNDNSDVNNKHSWTFVMGNPDEFHYRSPLIIQNNHFF